MQYQTRTDRLLERFPQFGQPFPEIALAVPVSNCDTPTTLGQDMEIFAADVENLLKNLTMDDRIIARGNIVYGIQNGLLPDRRKTPRNPGRHGVSRLAISEQHRKALSRIQA
jgi:hypothetical protein